MHSRSDWEWPLTEAVVKPALSSFIAKLLNVHAFVDPCDGNFCSIGQAFVPFPNPNVLSNVCLLLLKRHDLVNFWRHGFLKFSRGTWYNQIFKQWILKWFYYLDHSKNARLIEEHCFKTKTKTAQKWSWGATKTTTMDDLFHYSLLTLG